MRRRKRRGSLGIALGEMLGENNGSALISGGSAAGAAAAAAQRSTSRRHRIMRKRRRISIAAARPHLGISGIAAWLALIAQHRKLGIAAARRRRHRRGSSGVGKCARRLIATASWRSAHRRSLLAWRARSMAALVSAYLIAQRRQRLSGSVARRHNAAAAHRRGIGAGSSWRRLRRSASAHRRIWPHGGSLLAAALGALRLNISAGSSALAAAAIASSWRGGVGK